jgi:UDP-N-acetylmuramoyl-tripeptide--D-alanyl-D-alanine ligase
VNSITVEQIRIATSAQLSGVPASEIIFSICTDTRKLKPGCLFIALEGENHDGHHHLATAAAGGAIAAMVHDDCLTHLPLLRVADTRKAMGQLAAFVRRQLSGQVIAVAGSNGKTGTKGLIHAALSASKTGTVSPKSFNNDIGVPLTIFDADPSHDYLVLEIGTNHPGEVLNLTKIAQPDVAVITSIGAEHLEFLGDIDGVIEENAQIIAALNPDGLAVINGDCPQLLPAIGSYPGRVITFGFGSQNDLYPTNVECGLDGVRFRLDGVPIFIPQIGRHNAVNAVAAIAVGRHMGVGMSDIVAGLANATGPDMRLQLQTAGSIKILNDAYNANPHSMQAALETIRDMKTSGRKIAILGDMRELGETADGYHQKIGAFAADCDLDQLICIGEKSKLMADMAFENRLPVMHFATAADCSASIADLVTDGDLVLIKASRGMKLETVANSILSHAAAGGLQRELAARMKSVVVVAGSEAVLVPSPGTPGEG